ncbi:MAG TPA: ribosome recycling factor [bacterium]|nr:ribosome recycling factor [bacterium]
MKKAIESTKRDFSAIRTGRASSALVENVKVEYYGSLVPMNQVANIAVSDSRTLEIKPWDAQALGDIEKALLKSDVGVTPTNDGKLIRLSMPPLTEERRKEFVKLVHRHAEEGRVGIRGIRQDANKHLDQLKKDKTLSEDEVKKGQDRIQKMTDQYTDEIKKLSEHKEKEILEF